MPAIYVEDWKAIKDMEAGDMPQEYANCLLAFRDGRYLSNHTLGFRVRQFFEDGSYSHSVWMARLPGQDPVIVEPTHFAKVIRHELPLPEPTTEDTLCQRS